VGSSLISIQLRAWLRLAVGLIDLDEAGLEQAPLLFEDRVLRLFPVIALNGN
jgi:hypothetical protein